LMAAEMRPLIQAELWKITLDVADEKIISKTIWQRELVHRPPNNELRH
jgi:hypothetical protein